MSSPNPYAMSYIPLMLLGGRQSLHGLLHHKGSILTNDPGVSYSWLSFHCARSQLKGNGGGKNLEGGGRLEDGRILYE